MKVFKFFIYFNFLISVSFFTECLPYQKNKNQTTCNNRYRTRRFNKKNIFELRVEGIECDLCAQSIVDIITKYDGQEAYFQKPSLNYINAYTSFRFPIKKNPHVSDIVSDIKKEGFDNISIKGKYYGKLSLNEHKQPLFILNGCSITARVKEPPKNISYDKPIVIDGILKFENSNYWLII
ncbi:MAG: hypothetical protein WDZ41_03015 [Candidatus Babeliales bacterium]